MDGIKVPRELLEKILEDETRLCEIAEKDGEDRDIEYYQKTIFAIENCLNNKQEECDG